MHYSLRNIYIKITKIISNLYIKPSFSNKINFSEKYEIYENSLRKLN